MSRIIDQILTLLRELDDDDLRQFDVDIDTDVRSVSGGRRPMGPAHRRSDGSSHRPRKKRGREASETTRTVTRINRLLRKARREGYDVDEMLEAEASKPPLVRTDVGDDVIDIMVDRGDATLEIEDGVATISVRNSDHVESVPIAFERPVVETSHNMGVTTFHIRPHDGDDPSDDS